MCSRRTRYFLHFWSPNIWSFSPHIKQFLGHQPCLINWLEQATEPGKHKCLLTSLLEDMTKNTDEQRCFRCGLEGCWRLELLSLWSWGASPSQCGCVPPLWSSLKAILEKAMATHSNSCLENPMDGGAWWAAVYGVSKSRTWLSSFTFTFHFHALEREMATHSSVLAWRIPGAADPGGLPFMGSHRVGHDWHDLAVAAAAVCVRHWV